jgi:hypothetical protein
MILTTVQATSSDRLSEIRETIDHISTLVPAPPVLTPRFLNSLKGQVFVQLYAVIEHTMTESVATSIDHINSQNLKINDIKKSIWSLIMHPQFDSLIKTISKKWDKRWELTESIKNNVDCSIDNVIMPTDGRNFGYSQIEIVWKTFSISNPIFHDIRFRGRLSEIIDHRNKIAHGVTAASDIGNRNTINDLRNRHNEVSMFCSYCISVFENYLNNKEYRI